MRSFAEAKLPIALFAALLAVSVGLKAALQAQFDAPWPAHPELVADQLAENLETEGFSIAREHWASNGATIVATKGRCRLSVQDVSRNQVWGAVLTRDAASIGRLRYVLAGRRYDSAPFAAMFVSKVAAKLLHSLHIGASVPVPVALATAPACGPGDFGLGNIRVPV